MTWAILSLNIYTSMFAFSGNYPNQTSCNKSLAKNPPNYEWVVSVKQCVYVETSTINEWQQLQYEVKEPKL